MKLFVVVLSMSLLSTICTGATKTVKDYKRIFETSSQKIEKAHKTSLLRALDAYEKALSKTIVTCQQKGDLDAYTIVKEELNRFRSSRTVPDSKPGQIASCLEQPIELYRRETGRALAAKDAATVKLVKQYVPRLEALKRHCMLREEMTKAREVQNEIERVRFVQADTESRAPEPTSERKLPQRFASRFSPLRERSLRTYHGSAETEAAVLRSLRWLASQQNDDGSWNSVKPAMTGFALLAFLGHGETTASTEFGQTVRRGIDYLIGSLEADGEFAGHDAHDYAHPIATFALCEAACMIPDAALRAAATKAVGRIIRGQNTSGSFNYNLIPSQRNDLSYAGWCVQALCAAQRADLAAPGLTAAAAKAINGVKRNYGSTDTSNRLNKEVGSFGYTKPGSSALTGAGVLCLQLLGQRASTEARGGSTTLESLTATWGGQDKHNRVYHWYYITQAKFLIGGLQWTRWNSQLTPLLLQNQIRQGGAEETGYWQLPKDVAGHSDIEGRVMNTCLCTMMLETYYRYSR